MNKKPLALTAAQLRGFFRVLRSSPAGIFGFTVISVFALLAIFAPIIAPFNPFDVVYDGPHAVVRLSPPTWRNLFGTTNEGMDVFSQVIWGTRVAIMVGLLSSLGSVLLGTAIGLIAGYLGGTVDRVLMRLTDIAFAMPFLPLAMVVISVVKPSLGLVILLVVVFLWRTTARVVRAQTLSLKTRVYVRAARVAGASNSQIILRHILPSILPISFLYMAVGVQSGVMLESALSFLGFGSPDDQSWGAMLNAAFRVGALRVAWWWGLPPSIALSMFVIAVFMLTRAYETHLDPQLRVQ
jgi:peptide/nickel transport system permease protein